MLDGAEAVQGNVYTDGRRSDSSQGTERAQYLSSSSSCRVTLRQKNLEIFGI